MLDEQAHQPLRVEDEFVPAGLLVPAGRAAELGKGEGPPGPPRPRRALT